MKNQLLVILAFSLVALCIVGAIVLTAMNKSIPPNLWTVAYAALVGGAGIAVPTGGTTVMLTSPEQTK